jgi:hypothetical protein
VRSCYWNVVSARRPRSWRRLYRGTLEGRGGEVTQCGQVAVDPVCVSGVAGR